MARGMRSIRARAIPGPRIRTWGTRHFCVPLWSNDNDFEGCGVERVTTAELLKMLGVESKG